LKNIVQPADGYHPDEAALSTCRTRKCAAEVDVVELLGADLRLEAL
jgi:hypothetical protein